MLVRSIGALILLLATIPFADLAEGAANSQFLRRPDVHGDQVVFTSEGDLWIGSISEKTARRITSDEGYEGPAFFSPDGKGIAFTAQYDGGTDAYVMSANGGSPTRLTWDPRGVRVLGWHPDGGRVFFRSRRASVGFRNRFWEVSVDGGTPELVNIPYGEFFDLHQDGERVAYVPMSGEWQNWKRYRGGFADDIWMANLSTGTFDRLTDDLGVDTEPVWMGDAIYFASERGGTSNLYKLDPANKTTTPVTSFGDYDVRYPQSDETRVVFEYGNGIALFDSETETTTELELALASDRIHARKRRVSAFDQLAGLAIGPTGKRILASARGQILDAPVEYGDVRTLAASSGARCQYPAWSPDGKQVAFVSDQSGEDQIWLQPSNGGEAMALTKDHVGPLGALVWSPDGKKIVTHDREMRVLLVDAKSGAIETVDQSDRGGTYHTTPDDFAFSPDGKWLAYPKIEPNWRWTIWLYQIGEGRKVRITNEEMTSYSPGFDPEGKFLSFLSDREYSPTWVAGNEYFSYRDMTRVSLLALSEDTESPFLKKSDEEGKKEEEEDSDKTSDKDDKDKDDKDTDKKLEETKITLEGLADRIIDVPVPTDDYRAVIPVDGKLLLIARVDGENGERGGNQLRSFDFEDEEVSVIASKVTGLDLSDDKKKLLVRQDRNIVVMDATDTELPDDESVETEDWYVTIDPNAEWRQMFYETWRLGRDFFYDPNLHGVDWDAVLAKYEPLLDAVAHRGDLSFLQREIVAELNCGHAYIGGGDFERAPRIAMGYLGADLELVDGDVPAYRIAKLFPGDGFDLSSRSPLLTPGLKLSVGDYVLAIGGKSVRADQDINALLVGTAGKPTELTIASKPNWKDSRTVLVKPLSSERALRYYDWVESKTQYVKENGGENLGYLHIPDMSGRGLTEFGKHYYSQLGSDGMIYDVRHNGGGYIHSMLLLQMSSPQYSYFKPRHGESWSRQSWAFPGHSVALSNDGSGSNAEEFADAFRRLGLGPVIGTRSWGGEVGSGGGYRLVDGGAVFIPNYAAWTPDDGWIIEGVGVRPDIVVEDDPNEIMAGRDPQLDAAIKYLRETLEKEPVARPTVPAFPDKSDGGSDR